jgi:hypothetical protein
LLGTPAVLSFGRHERVHPSMVHIDALLDERRELTGNCRLAARLGDAG